MTATEPIAEGEAIARPAFVLREEPTDSGIVAYWGGERADTPAKYPPEVTALVSRRHICTGSERIMRTDGSRYERCNVAMSYPSLPGHSARTDVAG